MTPRDILAESSKLLNAGNIKAAGDMVRDAMQLQPHDRWLNLAKANVLLAGGNMRQAIEVLHAVTKRVPDFADGWFLIGNAFRGGKLYPQAVQAYRNVLSINPDFPGLAYNLGVASQYAGDLDGAESAYERALSKNPETALIHFRLAAVRHLKDNVDAAIAGYQDALKREPHHRQALTNLALALIARERDTEALSVSREHLRAQPGNTMALANLLYAAAGAGHTPIVNQLLDFDQLLGVHQFDSLALDELSQEILAAPELNNAQQTLYTTRNGYITQELKSAPGTHINALQGQLTDQVRDFLTAARDQLPEHPWAQHLPANWEVKLWGNVQSSGGYEDSHCHPRAFLSGVFYAQVPDGVGLADDGDPPGCLELGRGDDSYRYLRPKTHVIEPKPGLAVMFPSYFFHRTFPFESENQRISVPFDVVAKEMTEARLG